MGCGTSVEVNESNGPRSTGHHHHNGHNPNSNPGYKQPQEPPRYVSPEPQPKSDPEPKGDPDPAPDPQPENNDDEAEPESDFDVDPGPSPTVDPDVPVGKKEDNRKWRKRLPKSDEDLGTDEPDGFKLIDLGTKGSQFRMGRVTVTIETRQNSNDDSEVRPPVPAGQLWEDPDFTEQQALEGEEGVQFKRPKEICDNPQLFTEGTTRFDIVQGKVGTCYYLSILASLADKPDFLSQVIPENEYDPSSNSYDGVFHVRFWRFGQWIDVYVDDRIPVRDLDGGYQPWGARSCDPNEMWVSLMEKAYAKLHSSYKDVFGGLAGDAFVTLTGGVAENIKHDEDIDKPNDFFNRVSNALRGGSLVSSSVPQSKDNCNGLVGGHAYTVTGSGKVTFNGTPLSLLRIRNPWGQGTGEWTGPWSDESDEWHHISDEAKDALNIQGREDGEFWMTLQDFLEHYAHTFICNFTPDFDHDGIDDGLENVCSILGEWTGATAAGSDEDKKFNNPKYELQVPDNVGPDGTTPVVIQCLQNKKSRIKGEFEYVRVDLYKVDAKLKSGVTVYDEITNYLSFQGGQEVCYRYSLTPGQYLILPTTLETDRERQFLIRTFSSISLSCQEIKDKPNAIVRKCDMEFEHEDSHQRTDHMSYTSCAWKKGKNSGGQISNNTFHTNPQYHLTLLGRGPIPLTVLLMQDLAGSELAVGWKLWKASGINIPLDSQTVNRIYNDSICTTDEGNVFVYSYEAEGNYLLEAGEYLLLPFTDSPDDEKDFVLCFGTSQNCKVQYRAYNV